MPKKGTLAFALRTRICGTEILQGFASQNLLCLSERHCDGHILDIAAASMFLLLSPPYMYSQRSVVEPVGGTKDCLLLVNSRQKKNQGQRAGLGSI